MKNVKTQTGKALQVQASVKTTLKCVYALMIIWVTKLIQRCVYKAYSCIMDQSTYLVNNLNLYGSQHPGFNNMLHIFTCAYMYTKLIEIIFWVCFILSTKDLGII